MKKENIFILRFLLALSILLCAAAFIIQTAAIYHEAARQMYTAEIIARHFNTVSWIPVVMLTMIVVGAFLPYPEVKAKVPDEYRMQAVLKKVDKDDGRLAVLCKRMKMLRFFNIALAALCCAALLIIGTQKTLLVSMNLEYAVGQALPLLMIPVVIMFIGEAVLSYLSLKTAKKINEIAGSMKKTSPEKPEKNSDKKFRIIRAGLYAAAVILIVAGIRNGGMNGVLVKATVICTECIGLG